MFKNEKGNKYAIVKYYILVVIVAVLSVQITKLLHNVVGLPYIVGKAIADVIMFICNYKLQDKFVFRRIKK